jgi:signal transduction histidine kinase
VPVISVRLGADAASYRVSLGVPRLKRDLVVVGIAAVGVAAVACAFAFRGVWSLHANDLSLRSALEMALTLCALVSAALLWARFRHTRQLTDLLMLAALATAALTTFVFNTLPGYGYQTGVYGAGARSALSVLVAGTFLAVAVAPTERRVAAGRRLAKLALPAALGWVALGEAVDLLAGPVSATGPAGDFRGVSVVLALISFTGLVVCACAFVARRRPGDREALMLGGAALLLAIAQLSRLSLAVVPAGWITIGEGLRFGTYVLLLIVAIYRYGSSQANQAREAISAERQRIAQDLHDGLAQDLAFIAAHSDRLARELGSNHPLAVAAQRALATSRGQIIDLEASTAPDAETALREVAAELAAKFDVQIAVHRVGARPPGYASGERRQLVRIAREAIANAIRHGGARQITVTLGAEGEDLLLRVTDDGCGFSGATSATAGTGLGMQTMRERARHLGGQVVTRQTESGHTQLDVTSPTGGRRHDRTPVRH